MSAQLAEVECKIISALSGKALSVNGGVANDGTEVVQWRDENQSSQWWRLTRVADEGGDIFYTIRYLDSWMVMEAPGPWQRGAPLVMRRYERNGGDQRHRQWKFEPVPDKQEFYRIVNRRRPFGDDDEDHVIDVQDGVQNWNPPDPTNIKMYPSWNFPADYPGDRQHWTLIPR